MYVLQGYLVLKRLHLGGLYWWHYWVWMRNSPQGIMSTYRKPLYMVHVVNKAPLSLTLGGNFKAIYKETRTNNIKKVRCIQLLGNFY